MTDGELRTGRSSINLRPEIARELVELQRSYGSFSAVLGEPILPRSWLQADLGALWEKMTPDERELVEARRGAESPLERMPAGRDVAREEPSGPTVGPALPAMPVLTEEELERLHALVEAAGAVGGSLSRS